MVSRIDIGPEGGPFVAINENNNNLELQDINGNVIAKWDETAGQWDLNNNSLTGINAIDAGSVDVGDLRTNPTGALVQLDGNQSVASDTAATLGWDVEASRGEVSNLLDTNADAVVIPEGYDFAKARTAVSWDEVVDLREISIRKNGDGFDGRAIGFYGDAGLDAQFVPPISTSWFAVSTGDAITTQVNHQGGGSADVRDDESTFLEVRLI